jgi:hypothetical protein
VHLFLDSFKSIIYFWFTGNKPATQPPDEMPTFDQFIQYILYQINLGKHFETKGQSFRRNAHLWSIYQMKCPTLINLSDEMPTFDQFIQYILYQINLGKHFETKGQSFSFKYLKRNGHLWSIYPVYHL